MGTFATIQAEVLANLIDTPTAVQGLVPNFVNTAQKKLQEDHNFKVMAAEFAATTTAVRILGAVPANFKEFRSEPYWVDILGHVRYMQTAQQPTDIFRTWNPIEVGQPDVVLMNIQDDAGVGNFEIYPLSDGRSDQVGGQYNIVIPYWRFVPDLTGSTTNWFTVNAERFLVNFATSLGFQTDWDEERMTLWLQRAETWRLQVIKRDKLFRLSSAPQELVPHWRGARDTKLRK